MSFLVQKQTIYSESGNKIINLQVFDSELKELILIDQVKKQEQGN